MNHIRLICFTTLFAFACCVGTSIKSTDKSVKTNVIQNHNKIDNISSASEIESLLTGIDKDYGEFKVNSPVKFKNKGCQLLCDSLKVIPWVKKDFDGNGYTDLLVVGTWNEHSVICVMDSGENKFYIKRITRRSFQDCTFPVVKMVEQTPVIIYYSKIEPDWRHPMEKVRLTADTLIYQFGDFVEFNNQTARHKIEKIEYSTTGCFGTCPVFKLTINSDRTAKFDADNYNKKDGKYSARIDTSRFSLLINLLNYLDFVKLNNNYTVSWTDDQSCTLKITYDIGKVKVINDYGLIGTFGLNRIYNILFDLRENQMWK